MHGVFKNHCFSQVMARFSNNDLTCSDSQFLGKEIESGNDLVTARTKVSPPKFQVPFSSGPFQL